VSLENEELRRQEDYLKLLAQQYPDISSVCTEIINLNAIRNLPKGTEHFMSDLHGEDEAFRHILNNGSGVIREKVDMVFAHSMPEKERAWFATLIYYPKEKMEEIKRDTVNMDDWYSITLYRLVEVCKLVASKYTRSKVRKAMPEAFGYILDELLHTNYDEENKQSYYQHIISTIIDINRAEEVIECLCSLIKRLAVDCLHIVGDIYDRGERADNILDLLMEHHCVDIQWGNHDILWMGAAAGNEACIACVLNLALQYNTLDIVENGYGISLRDMISFAQETYKDCTWFMPRNPDDKDYLPTSMDTLSKVHKAIAIMQFKLEGQIIRRHPEYGMDDRLLLGNVDCDKRTVTIGGIAYPLNDCHFPTLDAADPYALSVAERELMATLRRAFLGSERLQKHVGFLYSHGSMYLKINQNLLFHGCIPMDEDGNFRVFTAADGRSYSGRAYMDYADKTARRAYYATAENPLKQEYVDFLWYLWCGRNSPLFGRDKISTFERYFVAEPALWKEEKDPYYRHIQHADLCDKILREFGLEPSSSHIINGHVPVKAIQGESPIKADGRLIVIDGGFCKAYHATTGIAGYTLIYSSHGLRLIAHESFGGIQSAIQENKDILTTTTIFETTRHRLMVKDMDKGAEIQEKIDRLKMLLRAYRVGIISPK